MLTKVLFKVNSTLTYASGSTSSKSVEVSPIIRCYVLLLDSTIAITFPSMPSWFPEFIVTKLPILILSLTYSFSCMLLKFLPAPPSAVVKSYVTLILFASVSWSKLSPSSFLSYSFDRGLAPRPRRCYLGIYSIGYTTTPLPLATEVRLVRPMATPSYQPSLERTFFPKSSMGILS
jgi:hypothetical protein